MHYIYNAIHVLTKCSHLTIFLICARSVGKYEWHKKWRANVSKKLEAEFSQKTEHASAKQAV